MTVRRYKPSDFPTIKQWGKEHGAEYSEDQFPKIGFIVDDVAAYFLYQTDSTCCWLENMISKKEIEPGVKERALSLIIDAILVAAKTLGFKVAYASTNKTTIALRAKKYGAQITPNSLFLALKLN